MTPEDIEQLKQLKQLVDSGVLSPEDFEVQKNLILSSTSRSADKSHPLNHGLSPAQQKIEHARQLNEAIRAADARHYFGGTHWPRTSTSTNDTVLAAQRAAVWVQYLAFLFAGSGILFGIILMAQKDEYNETNPYVGAGIGVAVNAVALAIILYAIGKYMEARLKQGSDASS